jgi:hypothetical protein
MFRATICALTLAAVAPGARAGELDRELPAAAAAVTVASAVAPSGSEMDRESPQSAHGWRWGWGRPYYGGWGWGLGGYYPASVSYFNIGFGPAFYRPFGYYGGFYNFGFGYRSFYPAYYAPFGYGWW